MKVFVLCGGKGTRLRPYTNLVPKPMLKLGNKPLLQYIVENLRVNGFKDLIFAVGYKKECIMNYFGNGKKFGVNILYLIEDEPKNTAGSVFAYNGKIADTFLVVMGDHLTNINLKKFYNVHKKLGGIATIALKEYESTLEYGVVEVKKNRVIKFKEKPKQTFLINTGIYAFEPKIFDYIKEKEDFAKHVFPRLISHKEKINAYLFKEYWQDIGRASDYEKINNPRKIANLLKKSK